METPRSAIADAKRCSCSPSLFNPSWAARGSAPPLSRAWGVALLSRVLVAISASPSTRWRGTPSPPPRWDYRFFGLVLVGGFLGFFVLWLLVLVPGFLGFLALWLLVLVGGFLGFLALWLLVLVPEFLALLALWLLVLVPGLLGFLALWLLVLVPGLLGFLALWLLVLVPG